MYATFQMKPDPSLCRRFPACPAPMRVIRNSTRGQKAPVWVLWNLSYEEEQLCSHPYGQGYVFVQYLHYYDSRCLEWPVHTAEILESKERLEAARPEQARPSIAPRLEERTKDRSDSVVIITAKTCYVPFTAESSAREGKLLISRSSNRR